MATDALTDLPSWDPTPTKMEQNVLARRSRFATALALALKANKFLAGTEAGRRIAKRLDETLTLLGAAVDLTGDCGANCTGCSVCSGELGADKATGLDAFAMIRDTVKKAEDAAKAELPNVVAKASPGIADANKVDLADWQAAYKLAEQIMGRHGLPAAIQTAKAFDKTAASVAKVGKTQPTEDGKKKFAAAAKSFRMAALFANQAGHPYPKQVRKTVKAATKANAAKVDATKPTEPTRAPMFGAWGVGAIAAGALALFLLMRR